MEDVSELVHEVRDSCGMDGKFKSIRQVFDILNLNDVNYLVLRNYENLLSEELYVNGHGDIDILCENSQIIVDLLGAKTNMKDIKPFKGDGTHYFIYVDKAKVFLDLRYVGDDYYCEKWECDMLSKRVKKDCFYFLPPLDYYYSLVYHAILQKRSLSDEYHDRLIEMSKDQLINVNDGTEREFIIVLEKYMRLKGYRYTYTKDIWIPF